MRVIEIKVYKFDELTEEGKRKAVENLYDINIDHGWWNYIYEDAENIGIKITEFDIDRGAYCHGDIITSAPEVIEAIIANHGKDCETYKTAMRYKPTFDELATLRDGDDNSFEDKFEGAEHEFLQDILEDYRIMLQKEYEYQTSEEAIIETIDANDYEFTENGKLI